MSDELQYLDRLCKNGTFSYEELQIAKQKIFEGSLDLSNADHLEAIKALNAITQLDREWELKRKNYNITGNQGLVEGFIIGVGCVWTIGSITPFAVLLTLFGVVMYIRVLVKCAEHDKALECYWRRRDELHNKSWML